MTIIVIVLTVLLSLFLSYITYANLFIVLGIVLMLEALALWLHKKKKWLFFVINLGALLVPVLLADGLFYGAKVPLDFIFIRGIVKVTNSNIFGNSDEEIIAKSLPAPKDGEEGYRVTNYVAPDGYTFQQFVTDAGVRMEKLEPNTANGKAILMVHGGAYIGKLTDIFNNYLQWYSEAAKGATVYSVDYKVASEADNYIETIEDVVNAYKFLIDSGYKSSDIVFAGDSAGGGLVLATCLYMRDNYLLDMPAGILTISAWTDLNGDGDSYKSNKRLDAQFGSNKVLAKAAKEYSRGEGNYYISPVEAEYESFPPVLMQVGSYEMLLDDTRTITDKMPDGKADVYPGMFHEFQMMKGSLDAADKAWSSISDFFVNVLKIN